MKIFQKIAGLCLALTLCAGMMAFAACGDGGNTPPASSSTPPESSEPAETPQATGHKFRVLDKDGNPVAGVFIQLCNDTCTYSAATDANGEVSYAGGDGEVEYDIHIWTVNPMNNPDGKEVKEFEFEGEAKTPAVVGEDVIVLTLKD